MAGSAATRGQGLFLIGIYTLGFVLPFLAVGLFTSQVLAFFKAHTNWLRWTAKAGGVLLILMGVMMFTGWMNGFTGYLSGLGTGIPSTSQSQSQTPSGGSGDVSGSDSSSSAPAESSDEVPDAPDFTLTDQFGNTHTLSDYKGKVVFLNFWATWCGPCKMEMPDIQRLYEDMGMNEEDVIILGVSNPRSDAYPNSVERIDRAGVEQVLADGGFTYPTVMDETGDVFRAYGVSAFPTTFMIDAGGKVYGYVPGMMPRDVMDSIIQQTIDGVRE